MKKIFKYEVLIRDHFNISMPKGAKILTVQAQHKVPQLWALIDPDEEETLRNFRLAGTGHDIPADLHREGEYKYIGSFQLFNGDLIYHLFELI